MNFAVFAVTFLVSYAYAYAEDFSFYETFQGKWIVSKTLVSQAYDIRKVEDSAALMLFGTFKELDASSIQTSEEGAIQLDFESKNVGSFSISNQEGTLEKLFDFNFNSFESDRLQFSFGKWNHEGTYQIIVHSKDAFTITVFPSNSETEEIRLFSAKRVIDESDKSFWQKYGSTLTIAGVFLFNMIVQRQLRPALSPQAPAPATAAAAAPGNIKSD